jgi:hypothetical protein
MKRRIAKTRRGSLLVESFVALFMLTALTAVCLHFYSAASEQRRFLFTRFTAAQEAANLMERTEALDWADLSTEAAAKFQLSQQARQVLPEGRFEIVVDAPGGNPPAKRVVVAVHWRPQSDGPEREVRLTAWRYKNP